MAKAKQKPEVTSEELAEIFLPESKKDKVKSKVKTRIKTENIISGSEIVSGIIKKKTNKDIWKKIAIGSIISIVVVLLGTTTYFYRQWKQVKTDPQSTNKEDVVSIVAQISRFIELPTEEPTMATVTSVEKLKDQQFFANAQNGDKALIFSKAGKAILYRPVTGKIIEVISLIGGGQSSGSPVIQESSSKTAINSESSQSAPAETSVQIEAPKSVDVTIYNGTTQKGLAKAISTKIAGVAEAKVIKTGNSKGNFEKTIVVDLNGDNQELAKKIAETIGGEVGIMPENEIKPEDGILIIGGINFKG